MQIASSMRTTTLAWFLLALVGCGESTVRCDEPDVERRITFDEVTEADLLFVVDDSSSMAEEQAALADALPRLIGALTTGDVDGDGMADRNPVPVLHVGVTTTDMGTGGYEQPTCDAPDRGGDGRLRACESEAPSFLAFDARRETDALGFVGDVTCLTTAGTTGCGFEQPLEAALKALSPSRATLGTAADYVPPAFFGGTAGHGDGAHAGFVGDDAVLVILPVTDEDDCSASDPALFDPVGGPYGGTEPNLRCNAHPEALHSVQRYVEGLLQLRTTPARLVYAPVVGVPEELARPGTFFDWNSGDPRLVPTPDPERPDRLLPSCEASERGRAYPPARLLAVGEALEQAGAFVTVTSICAPNLADSLVRLTVRVLGPSWPQCPDAALPRGEDGRVECTMHATLPSGRGCEGVPGASPVLDTDGLPLLDDGRAVCALAQLVPSDDERAARRWPEGAGWWYDDYIGSVTCSEQPSRIIPGQGVPSGAELTWRCAAAVLGGGLGDDCAPDSPGACAGELGAPAMICDTSSGRCAATCETDDDCQHADLVDSVCVARTQGGPTLCTPSMCAPR